MDISSKVQEALLRLIIEAIQSGQFNANMARRVVLQANSALTSLEVAYSQIWGENFCEDQSELIEQIEDFNPVLGNIAIGEWKNKVSINSENPNTAISLEAIAQKYAKTPPANNFEHTTPETLRNNYIIAREQMIKEVDKAIRVVSEKLSTYGFRHIVGFFTYNLAFKEGGRLISFTVPNSNGLNFKVSVNHGHLYRFNAYLIMRKENMILINPEGNFGTNKALESYSRVLDAKDFDYVLHGQNGKQPSVYPFTFKLKWEDKEWVLKKGNVNEALGELNEDMLYAMLRDFFNKNKDITFRRNDLPHPLLEAEAFHCWADAVINYKINLYYEQRQLVKELEPEAVQYLIDYFPPEHPGLRTIIMDRAEVLFKEKNFGAAIAMYSRTLSMYPENRYHIMECYFLTGNTEKLVQVYHTIEMEDRIKIPAICLYLIHQIKCTSFKDPKQQEIKSELKRLKKRTKYQAYQDFIQLVWAYWYCKQNKIDRAKVRFHSIQFPNRYVETIMDFIFDPYSEMTELSIN